MLLGLEIPERDVDGGERELGDAGAADPLQSRVAGELQPEPRIVSEASSPASSWRVAVADTGCDQPVGGKVGMGAGEAVAGERRLR
jgi:hypothetical protein